MLDEKEVNIEVLRDNVRTYQDMERTLDNVKKRMAKLEKIRTFHRQAKEAVDKDQMYGYFLNRSDVDLVESRLKGVEAARKSEELRLNQAKQQMEMLKKEIFGWNCAIIRNLQLLKSRKKNWNGFGKNKMQRWNRKKNFRKV